MRFPAVLFVLLFTLTLAGCATDRERVTQTLSSDPVDMAGNWELDYGRSDNLQARFNMMMRQLRDQAARSNGGERSRAAVAAGSSSLESMISLAQMAELVTQSQLLEISQSRIAIRVEREDNFSLSCDYGIDAVQRQEYAIGQERCFWDGQQLVFEIRLPEGLDIVHRLSVANSGETLAIVTSLYSPSVSTPFSIRRIYRRFEPGASEYRCTETLTRGRVCTTEK
ncbi:MAG: hypothetical protein AAGG55_03950 [Pseudomonadota bacterium]